MTRGGRFCGTQVGARGPKNYATYYGHSWSNETKRRRYKMTPQEYIFLAIKKERERQDEKWGEQNHAPSRWVTILGEEFGSICKEVNSSTPDLLAYEREIVHTVAVGVAMIECLARGKWKWPSQ